MSIATAGMLRLTPKGHAIATHKCATCPTTIPASRPLCWFCSRPPPSPVKTCLRCKRERPLDLFADSGRFRLCDDCRWTAKPSSEEKLASRRLSREEWKQRHLRAERLKDRERKRAA